MRQKQELKYRKLENKYQLTISVNHHINKAEQEIQIFKVHFIVDLYSIYSKLTLKYCDKLVDQATISLNMMRK